MNLYQYRNLTLVSETDSQTWWFFKDFLDPTLFFQTSAKSIDQEIDMATNETSSSITESKTEDSVDSSKNQTKVTFEKNLVSQENRTRIAFLEMQQAELETEIRLLKQNGKNNLLFLTCSGGFLNSNFQLFVLMNILNGRRGCKTHRSLGHHLLNSWIFRFLVLSIGTCGFWAFYVYNKLHLQIQIPNALNKKIVDITKFNTNLIFHY